MTYANLPTIIVHISTFCHFKARNYSIIPCGVPMEQMIITPKDIARQQLGWSPDKKYILFGGAFSNTRKNYVLLRDAVAQLGSFSTPSDALIGPFHSGSDSQLSPFHSNPDSQLGSFSTTPDSQLSPFHSPSDPQLVPQLNNPPP